MSRPIPIPLRVLPPPAAPGKLVPCLECGYCCTYLAVGINTPSTPRFATDVLWYLYHERVSVHRGVDGDWSVVFETRCRNLQSDFKCSVYAQRPHICRRFDETGCEVNAPDQRDRVFVSATEFLEHLRGWKPKTYARLQKNFVPEVHRPKALEPGAPAARWARPRRRPAAGRSAGVKQRGAATRAKRTAARGAKPRAR